MMMHRGLLGGLGVMVWGLFHLGMWGTPATAAPVTFQFAGNLTSVSSGQLAAAGFSAGQSFAGSYTFDPDTLDSDSSASLGSYWTPTGSFTATIGSYTVSYNQAVQEFHTSIFDNYEYPSQGPKDSYIVGSRVDGAVVNGLRPRSFAIHLVDPSHTAFDSDALLSSPPSLSSFTSKKVEVWFEDRSRPHLLSGEIHSLTAVPVPAAVLLFGTGLTALIGLGAGTWRRKLTHLA